ncbi:hypothetical protein EI77_00556 [Prosthecobacter fusiformis]|uniref:Outer membrane beta-barrel porin/alpha-amylase n=1 Tax=Prosthecobacter fusiformis TaxID=48464 RepID=A0A4V3FI68_9BACT|nr:hypothetical protein [Prosthecobacter fusiformis]TDU81253.1 hypothetical protein EI77_00556 [Prosthecobacter fusiformis]
MKTLLPSRLKGTLALLALSAGLAMTPATSQAGEKNTISPVVEPPPSPWIHALLKVDVSDHYVTPRGLNVENQGLIVQPLFLIFWNLYSNPDGFINDVTLTTGVWSSIHTRTSGPEDGNWNEVDPIAGLAFKFAKYWQFDVNYTAFESMVSAYPTSHHLELKLSFNDAAYTGSKTFSLNPYVAFWKELKNKSTVTFNESTSSESYYFTVGINPTIDLKTVKFEFPTFVNIVDNDFYQQFDGTGGGSGAAVFRTGVQASIPLSFVPKSMGFWSLYAGVKYYHLDNPGVLDGNMVLGADGARKRDILQFHGGVSIFF